VLEVALAAPVSKEALAAVAMVSRRVVVALIADEEELQQALTRAWPAEGEEMVLEPFSQRITEFDPGAAMRSFSRRSIELEPSAKGSSAEGSLELVSLADCITGV
jgi:hypothetical protein